MSHSVVFIQVAGEWLKIMKSSCSQLTDSPLHWVPVHVPSMKSHFLPPSLVRDSAGERKGGGKMMDNTLTQHWPDSQCEASVPWWTNKQRGLSHDPTASPIPCQHSFCSSIMQQTHAYSRANHVTTAGTPCKVVKIGKEHVIQMGQYLERTKLSCDCIIMSIKD